MHVLAHNKYNSFVAPEPPSYMSVSFSFFTGVVKEEVVEVTTTHTVIMVVTATVTVGVHLDTTGGKPQIGVSVFVVWQLQYLVSLIYVAQFFHVILKILT